MKNDIQIIDENGRLVWAKDLARRYRAEKVYRERKGGSINVPGWVHGDSGE